MHAERRIPTFTIKIHNCIAIIIWINASCFTKKDTIVVNNAKIKDIFILFSGLTLSATTAGIMYPLMLKIGTEKNEMIIILSAIAAVGLQVLLSAVLHRCILQVKSARTCSILILRQHEEKYLHLR